MTTHPPDKPCAACGRPIEWRRKWARCWDQVRYCSDACRRGKGASPTDAKLEAAILSLLADRKPGETICPSEAARRVGGADWHTLMEPTRAAARRLAGRGAIEVTQGGRVVDPATVRGPIRLRTRRP